MNFYIFRDDKLWYAGTVDKAPIWTGKKERAAPFSTTEQAEQRINGLPDRHTYSVER